MSDVIVGLVSLLKSDATLSGVISGRVFPIPAPEDLAQYPCVSYQVTSEVNNYTLDGPDNVNTVRVVIDCFAAAYPQARAAALAVKALLNGYTGTLPDGTQVFETEIATVQDGWEDGSRMSKVSVHVLLTYNG